MHRFVVLADRARGFDTLSEARRFCEANVPSVVCERVAEADGSLVLREVLRHDWLFDAALGTWRFLMATPDGEIVQPGEVG
jgi:hypothetical protein